MLLDVSSGKLLDSWLLSLGGDPDATSTWSQKTDCASPSPSRTSKSKKRSLFSRKK